MNCGLVKLSKHGQAMRQAVSRQAIWRLVVLHMVVRYDLHVYLNCTSVAFPSNNLALHSKNDVISIPMNIRKPDNRSLSVLQVTQIT